MQKKLLNFFLKGKAELARLYRDERGVEIVQVAIITAILALGSIAVLTALGSDITNYYEAIRSKFMGTQPTI